MRASGIHQKVDSVPTVLHGVERHFDLRPRSKCRHGKRSPAPQSKPLPRQLALAPLFVDVHHRNRVALNENQERAPQFLAMPRPAPEPTATLKYYRHLITPWPKLSSAKPVALPRPDVYCTCEPYFPKSPTDDGFRALAFGTHAFVTPLRRTETATSRNAARVGISFRNVIDFHFRTDVWP